MESLDEHRGSRATSRGQVLHLLFPGDAASVRRALKTAMDVFRDMAPGGALTGLVEIVLAEALNNIVEHAYGDHGRGLVDLEVEHRTSALVFRILDEGLPMPGGDAPSAKAQDLDVAVEDLPEGGFGWFLIRELTEDLSYRRVGDRNELTFRMALGPEGAEDRRGADG